VGLLAVDVTVHGVVMSGDSQRVEIVGGQNRVQVTSGERSRNPIVTHPGREFTGLVGFAGTEELQGLATAEWLRRFGTAALDDTINAFCDRLATTLTAAWNRTGTTSVLEVLVAGEVRSDVQFWYVRNSQGVRPDGKHNPPATAFTAENDLDKNYIPRDVRPGEAKEDVLRGRMYSFWQGVLVPAAPVFDGFASLMSNLYANEIEGFAPIASLDDLAHFAHMRMEFLKRLCTARYGIYQEGTPAPIGGVVHVWGVARNGEVRRYTGKGRKDVKTMHAGRSSP
jgi:hypothetical protein